MAHNVLAPKRFLTQLLTHSERDASRYPEAAIENLGRLGGAGRNAYRVKNMSRTRRPGFDPRLSLHWIRVSGGEYDRVQQHERPLQNFRVSGGVRIPVKAS